MFSSTEMLEEILRSPQDALKAYRTAPDSIQALRALAEHLEHREVRLFLASCPDTPSSIIEKIYRTTTDGEIVLLLTRHPHLDSKFLLELAQSGSTEVKLSLADARPIKPQVAKQLCEDRDPFVRVRLAQNPSILTTVQRLLADDEVPFVRAGLLLAPKMSLDEDFRASLADDLDPVVQFMAITSQRIAEETLLSCADTQEEFVQTALLTRPDLPESVLQLLCFSPHEKIKQAALRRKRLAPFEMMGFACDSDKESRERVAQMENLPPVVQKKLAQDTEKSVLLKLAGNPSLDEETAETLREVGDQEILFRLARNPAIPTTILLELAQGGNAPILKQLAEETTIQSLLDIIYATNDDAILYHLAFRATPPTGMPEELLYRLATHPLPAFRALVASMGDVPVLLQAQLARDDSADVRLAMAKNKSAQSSLLERLSEDPNAKVKKAAAETFRLVAPVHDNQIQDDTTKQE